MRPNPAMLYSRANGTRGKQAPDMAGIAFDTLKLARRLREKAGFTPEHAEEAAEAVGGAEFATETDLRDLEQRLIIKVGGMMIVAVGIILAALRFLPASRP